MAGEGHRHLGRQDRLWVCPDCAAVYEVPRDFERTPKFGVCFDHDPPADLRLVLNQREVRLFDSPPIYRGRRRAT